MNEKLNWTYCVVGNIKKTHFDESGTLRYGTGVFVGGAKVYIAGRMWDGTTDYIGTLGLTRGQRLRLVRTDVSLVENLRCQKVFRPSILKLMNNFEHRSAWWGKSESEKASAEAFVEWWNAQVSGLSSKTP